MHRLSWRNEPGAMGATRALSSRPLARRSDPHEERRGMKKECDDANGLAPRIPSEVTGVRRERRDKVGSWMMTKV